MKTFVQKHVKPIHYLLLAVPLAVVANALHLNSLVIFALAALGLVPLAELIGEATEALAAVTGPKIGGLLNATLGNAAELIITIVALRAGLFDLVKASITGSILGNLLLVLGAALLAGGLKNGKQTFNREHAATSATSLVLAVMALSVPSIFNHTLAGEALPPNTIEYISLGVAALMIVLYALTLIYSLRASRGVDGPDPTLPVADAPAWSVRTALIVLAVVTLAIVFLSELLVSTVEPVTAALGLSEFFIGIILIPIIGNVAEHLVAVEVAIKRNMDLSLEIALSSSQQIALFVAPILVFVALLFGQQLSLVFNQFELLSLIAAVGISALVASDGESNWLEGAQLLGLYLIFGVAFFFIHG